MLECSGDNRKHTAEMTERVLALISDLGSSMQILQAETMSKLSELGEKLDRLYEIVGVPRDPAVPTLEEQLAAASTNEAVRREIQRLVAEAEFENTEVEYFE